VVVSQGDIWWADLPEPTGSGPGFRRPVVIIQSDALNRSRLPTVVCVPITSNLLLPRHTGLSKTSVANVSQIVTLDRSLLSEQTGKLPDKLIDSILSGVDIILGR
jgi:mRNA interferase MazF